MNPYIWVLQYVKYYNMSKCNVEIPYTNVQVVTYTAITQLMDINFTVDIIMSDYCYTMHS